MLLPGVLPDDVVVLQRQSELAERLLEVDPADRDRKPHAERRRDPDSNPLARTCSRTPGHPPAASTGRGSRRTHATPLARPVSAGISPSTSAPSSSSEPSFLIT